jgi:hypothetical protein
MSEFQLPYKALPHSEFEVCRIKTYKPDEDLYNDASHCVGPFLICIVQK